MDFMQIFTLVTGVLYIILEIRQKNFMWVVGVITSLAAMWVFFRQGLYASFALNTYYLITSFVGLWQWSKDKKKVQENESIHLNRLTLPVVLVSLAISVVGVVLLAEFMVFLENPMSYLDASVAVLSAVATWWLVKAYLQQWWLWVVADALSVALCLSQEMWWMAALYLLYVLSAIYGLIYWKKHGTYVI